MFRDAALDDIIEQTPCVLTSRQLGPLVDKDPEWRADAVFARAEVEMLISDERIPIDRRVLYALDFLAGIRHGEGAALRWRHFEPKMKPLGRLRVAVSYSSSKHEVKTTKTGTARQHPVPPVLAAILANWKLCGWPEMVGRPPGPDDLLIPLPPANAAKRVKRWRDTEPFRDQNYSWTRFREDLTALASARSRKRVWGG